MQNSGSPRCARCMMSEQAAVTCPRLIIFARSFFIRMIFEGEFFYNGTLRWNLGWATPNYAGAFLCTLAPFAWAIGDRRASRYASLLFEVILYFLLAKTCSRGSLVAWAAAAAFFVAARDRKRLLSEEWLIWITRFVALGCIVYITGFTTRVVPSSIMSDYSVLNRLELWSGGLAMVAASPFSGWGSGESGSAYMNWFQHVDREESYRTMVNSYLHIAVEYGLVVLFLVVSALSILVLRAWDITGFSRERLRNRSLAVQLKASNSFPVESLKSVRLRARMFELFVRLQLSGGESKWLRICAAAGSSIVAWMVVNIFSTLWSEWQLWIVPALAAVTLCVSVTKKEKRFLPIAVSGGTIGAAISLIVYISGYAVLIQQPLEIRPLNGGAVQISSRAPRGSKKVTSHMWVDKDVLGPWPGKEVRRWIAFQKVVDRAIVYRNAPVSVFRVPSQGDFVYLFGKNVGAFDFSEGVGRLTLIHPAREVDVREILYLPAREVALVLPQVDEAGCRESWLTWAHALGLTPISTLGVGQDIRAVWPRVMSPEG
jgi:hypothetical protein